MDAFVDFGTHPFADHIASVVNVVVTHLVAVFSGQGALSPAAGGAGSGSARQHLM
jgi:hypothetical protein